MTASDHFWRRLHLPDILPGQSDTSSINVHIENLRTDWKVCERVDWKDGFGNTSLHYAAAWGADYEALSALIDKVCDINSVNTAGQTFMHVLDPVMLSETFPALIDNFLALIDKLDSLSFRFDLRDHYGQTVFHHLTKRGFLIPSSPSLRYKRDAGGNALLYLQSKIPDPIFTASARFVASLRGIMERHIQEGPLQVFASLDAIIESCHAARDLVTPSYMLGLPKDELLGQTWEKAYVFGWTADEDSFGRNGLHILAHPSWDLRHSGWTQCFGQVTNIQKRVMNSLLRNHADVNAYDKSGETPLMAFAQATHMWDPTLEFMLINLIQRGACVNQRNRIHQTPLHIAVASGNMTATTALIKFGANIHAREIGGQGIVAVAMHALKAARDEGPLYAKIATCMALAIDAGAVGEPDEIMEWTMPTSSMWKDRSV